MQKTVLGFSLGMLVAWALMLISFFAQVKGNFNNVEYPLSSVLIWLTLFAAIGLGIYGSIAKD